MANLRQRPWVFLGLFFYLFATFLHYPPLAYAQTLGPRHFVGTLFFFLAFLISCWGLGQALNHWALKSKQLNLAWVMALGGALLAVLALILASLNLRPSMLAQGLKTAVMAGMILSTVLAPPKWTWPTFARPDFLNATLISYLLLCALVLCVPHPFWDSMWYHLTAPRQWFMAGKMFYNPQALINAQASFVELLYLYGNALMTGPQAMEKNIWQVHLFCQWLNFSAVVFSLLALKALFADLFKTKLRPYFFLALFFVLLDFPLHYSSLSAKNDWWVLLWGLCAWSFLKEENKRAHRLGLILLGLTVGAKFTYAFYAILLLMISRRRLKLFARGEIIFFLLPVLVILIRNFLWTHNPFFPSYASLFSADLLGPTWQQGMAQVEGGLAHFDLSNLQRKLRLLFWPRPFLLLLLFFPLSVARLPAQKRQELWEFFGVGLFGVGFIFFKTGAMAEFRLLAICHIFLMILSFWTLSELLPKKRWAPLLVYPLLVFLLLSSRPFDIPTLGKSSLWRFFTDSNWTMQEHLQTIPGLASTQWLRQHARAGEKIYLLSDPKLFYLSDLGATRIWDEASLDRELHQTHGGREVLLRLARDGRYLMDSVHDIDHFHPKALVAEVIAELKKYPEALVFQSRGDWVVDLKKLQIMMGE